ncbi:MAG: TonB-dependent receptor [Opitutaceae bacterium]|jgi:outer membrane receptor for ferric coprogen and ferric-rhodotorulic acid|nr:TonB-dependent receptor [Opitutaceae bacterium]
MMPTNSSIVTRRRSGFPPRAALSLILLLAPVLAPAVAQAQSSPAVDPRATETGSVDGSLLLSRDPDRKTGAVRVTVLETGAVATVDEQGQFSFPDLLPGTWTLIAGGEGYGRLRITDVVVRPGQKLALERETLPLLSAANGNDELRLEDVVVRARRAEGLLLLDPLNVTAGKESYIAPVSVASKLALPIREVPQSVSVITEQRIKDQMIPTIVDAVNQVTGITIRPSRTSPNPTIIQARGYPMGVSHDGVPANNTLSYSQFDLSFYQQLEVLRGAVGLFASGGFSGNGGTINLIEKHAQKDAAWYAQLSAGSWNNFREEIDLNQPLTADGALRARLVAFHQDQEFFYDRTSATTSGLHGDITWEPAARTRISLSGSVQKEDSDAIFDGIPRLPRNTLFKAGGTSYNPAPDWSYYNTRINEIALTVEQKINLDWAIKTRAAHGTDEYDYHNAFALSLAPDATHGYTTSYRNYDIRNKQTHDSFDIYLSGLLDVFDREHTLVIGYNYERYREQDHWAQFAGPVGIPWRQPGLVPDFSRTDPAASLSGGKATVSTQGLYGQTRLTLIDPLKLHLGSRVSWYENTADGETNSENGQFTPYAGLTFDVSKNVTLYASYSDVFTPQTHKKIGGGTLEPAIGWQTEAGVKAEFFNGRLSSSLAVFKLTESDKAFAVDRIGSVTYYDNIGEQSTEGIELEIIGKLWEGAEVTLGYTWTDQSLKHLTTNYTNNTASLNAWSPVTPEHQFRFWGVQRWDLGNDRRLLAGLGFNWFSGNADFRATTITTTQHNASQSSYSVANAVLGYQFNKHLRLNLNLNNIFDTTYYENFNGWGDRFGAPRNFTLTARYDF